MIISVVVPVISAQIIINLTTNMLEQVLLMSLVLMLVEWSRNVANYGIRFFSQVIYRETFIDVQNHLGSEMLWLENTTLDQNSSGVFIQRLTNDTIVGEGGISLSGGQRQRLAIARAFIQKTEIILFDEATSALDNETQASIQKAIENMQKEYTILIIAHRLSTVINSDRILFLDDGKITNEGTHEELLKKCPEYKKLYDAEMQK